MCDFENPTDNKENIQEQACEQKQDLEKEADTVQSPYEKPKQSDFVKGILEQIELAIIAFSIIVIIVFSFVCRTCRVSGPSMENTLYNNETVISSNLFYTPKHGDIIVFHQTGSEYNEPIVKRIIGLPGDTVSIEYFGSDSMRVTVDYADGTTQVLNETYIKYSGSRYLNSKTYVEEGTVFAMGDNRSNSADSRSSAIGLIDQERILGRVIFRITPFSRFGKVE